MNEKFDKIYESLDGDLKKQIEIIRRYIKLKKAAVMVGAGFSMNANTEAFRMKTWNEIGGVFANYLNRDGEHGGIKDSPIRLASIIEANFKKPILDGLILKALYNESMQPAKVHIDLLNLSWNDIFTVNYDTLLEKANAEIGNKFRVIRTKEELIYSKSPRIVKLHGSFPSGTPFIMSEEDYRKYPMDHREFVNTVRQSLIENLFVLIGFSDNDPNFFQWMGWLLDVMGDLAMPAYMISVDNVEYLDRKFHNERNVEVVDLGKIKDLSDPKEKIEFLLYELKDSTPINDLGIWNSYVDYKLETQDEVKKTIAQMKSVREAYPGWVFMPTDYYTKFDDVIDDFPLWGKKFENFNEKEKLQFLYELDWRLTISFSPKDAEWYIAALNKLFDNKAENLNQSDKTELITLMLSLLDVYRKKSLKDDFNRVKHTVDGLIPAMDSYQLNRYYYIVESYFIETVDFDAAEKIIDTWTVARYDFWGNIWKSEILNELNKATESINMLNACSDALSGKLLLDGGDNKFLTSAIYHVNSLLSFYERCVIYKDIKRNDSKTECDFYEIAEEFKTEVVKDILEGRITSNHQFNIGKVTTTYHSGSSGFYNDYAYACRFLNLYEMAGIPFHVGLVTINSDSFIKILSKLINYDFCRVVNIIIRKDDTKLAENCISRQVLHDISKEEANNMFDFYLSRSQYVISKNQLQACDFRKVHFVIIKLLIKLCVRVSVEKILPLVNLIISQLQYVKYEYSRNELDILYSCMTEKQKADVIHQIYNEPLNLDMHEDDILLPSTTEKITLSENEISLIIAAFQNNDKKMSEVVFFRIAKVWKNCPALAENMDIVAEILNWRNDGNFSRGRIDSYNYFKWESTAINDKSPYLLVEEYLKELDINNYKVEKSSAPIDKFRNKILNFWILKDFIGDNGTRIIHQVVLHLETNEEKYKVDDSNSFLGGFRSFSSNLINTICGFLHGINLKKIDKEELCKLQVVLTRYNDYGFNLLYDIVTINNVTQLKDSCFFEPKMKHALLSEKTSMINDGIKALVNFKNDDSISEWRNELIIKLINFAEYKLTRESNQYIMCVTDIDNDLKIKFKKQIIDLMGAILSKVETSKNFDSWMIDVAYNSFYLAGKLSKIQEFEDEPCIKLWENLSQSDEMFNDVRLGFEIGKR